MNIKIGNKLSRNMVYIAAFVLVSLISLVYKLYLSGTFDGAFSPDTGNAGITVVTEQSSEETSIATDDTLEEYISVYICGEVVTPGVYEVPRGDIVNDVVNLAGGFTENAASDRVDLVSILDRNVSLYIPREGEAYADGIVRAEQNVWGIETSRGEPGNGLVNINYASRDQLMTLPGIGAVTADAIIEYREQQQFQSTEDIMNVPGIGEAKFNGIRDLICV